jgi:hypothetical protein
MTLNPDTRIIVHCYAGDMHQLNLDNYLQHECPVTIMSPDDSRAVFDEPGIDCAYAGKRAYIGQDSLDRQREHMRLMLTYPENYFLCHDSDSYVLDAKIPDYIYAEPNLVWSNQVDDAIPEHQDTFLEGWPHVAFQPPYFLSRQTIEAMLAVADDPRVQASPVMPFIDYYMVQLTMVAGLRWKRFRDCLSCPITADPKKKGRLSADHVGIYERGYKIALQGIAGGANIIHSNKDPQALYDFMDARKAFLSGNPEYTPRVGIPPRVGPVPTPGQPRRRAMSGPPAHVQTGAKA